uniref:Uncharacterized protein n=1 Tax=Arundo donax TaxID=35708 RepID=A0A0A9D0Q1_ARUDO
MSAHPTMDMLQFPILLPGRRGRSRRPRGRAQARGTRRGARRHLRAGGGGAGARRRTGGRSCRGS